MFSTPPVVDFRPQATHCSGCGCELHVQKTRGGTLSTLHISRFQAREWLLVCPSCARTHRSEELCALVPPGANFGYDVMVHAGKAFFLRHRNEEEVVAELGKIETIEEKIVVFDKLREAMRIAPKSGGNGLNDEGKKGNIHTILEQFFRSLKRANRRRTGNASPRRMLQTILAEESPRQTQAAHRHARLPRKAR